MYVPPHRKVTRVSPPKTRVSPPRRPQTRYKAFVIPIINGKYVVVQNAGKYQNLTFIGGGCHERENTKNCALRELAEETRHSVLLRRNQLPNKSQIQFNVTPRERNASRQYLNKNRKQGVSVTMRHNFFLVPIKNNFNNIKRRYHSRRSLTRSEKETINIFLKSKNELNKARSPQLWNFMRKRILEKL